MSFLPRFTTALRATYSGFFIICNKPTCIPKEQNGCFCAILAILATWFGYESTSVNWVKAWPEQKVVYTYPNIIAVVAPMLRKRDQYSLRVPVAKINRLRLRGLLACLNKHKLADWGDLFFHICTASVAIVCACPNFQIYWASWLPTCINPEQPRTEAGLRSRKIQEMLSWANFLSKADICAFTWGPLCCIKCPRSYW